MGDEGPGDGTVGKALDVLDMVAMAGRPMRFTELLSAGTYPKATMYRFLQTLTNQGMLTYDPDRQAYTLGVRLVRLAHTAWAQSSLAPIARPWIDALSGEVGETIHLAQMDQAQVLYVDKRHATRAVEMFSQAGKVGPAYCTGVGKAMLAFLPADVQDRAISRQAFHRFTDNTICTPIALLAELQLIRKRGFALDNEEHEPGIICIALPILTQSGRVMGALSVTSTTSRSSLDALALLSPRIAETANAIATEAESWRFPEDY
jgi:IclR family transcriptional regulator, KDG regulon repressor